MKIVEQIKQPIAYEMELFEQKFLLSIRYKVIFMNRDLAEVVKSQQKMIGKDSEALPIKLLEAYQKQLNQVERWKEKEPGVELIYVDYKDVVNKAAEVVEKVSRFIGVDMNKEEMISSVDKSLYRNVSN